MKNNLRFLPDLSDLVNLEILDVSNNCLTEFPSTMWKLVKLTNLNAERNMLERLPPFMGSMGLRRLSLNVNQIESIDPLLKQHPSTPFVLASLEILKLNFNRLSRLPNSIVQLVGLKKLYVCSNKLKYLPPAVGRLTRLELLWGDYNQLNALPDTFHQLRNLKR